MVVIVLVIAIYWTQTKTQRHLEQRPDIANAAGKIEYQNESFNPRGVALPPNFHGADLLGIYAALKQRPALLKGEYETTESFNKRVEESAKQPVLGSLLVTSVYAFSNPVKRSQYDADRGVLDFQPLLGEMGMPLGSTERRQSAPVDYVALSIGAGLGMVFWGPTIYQTLLWEKRHLRPRHIRQTHTVPPWR